MGRVVLPSWRCARTFPYPAPDASVSFFWKSGNARTGAVLQLLKSSLTCRCLLKHCFLLPGCQGQSGNKSQAIEILDKPPILALALFTEHGITPGQILNSGTLSKKTVSYNNEPTSETVCSNPYYSVSSQHHVVIIQSLGLCTSFHPSPYLDVMGC